MAKNIIKLKKLAKEVSLLTLDISYKARTCHVGSALSISDIITVLYFGIMNTSPKNIESYKRDIFILSKGHATASLYAVLFKKGILSKKKLESFGQNGGLCEHPESTDPGIELSTGSLGHGLAFGIGTAYAQKLKGLSARTYVLISDGECEEGSVWEAALLASRLRLNNLVVILDYNKWQCFGKTKDISSLDPLEGKWEVFGWSVEEIDGHSIKEIVQALERTKKVKNKPLIIIANTITGRGVSVVENKLLGHYKVFSEEEYKTSRKELERL